MTVSLELFFFSGIYIYIISKLLKKTIVKSDLAKQHVFVRCPLVNMQKDADNSTFALI